MLVLHSYVILVNFVWWCHVLVKLILLLSCRLVTLVRKGTLMCTWCHIVMTMLAGWKQWISIIMAVSNSSSTARPTAHVFANHIRESGNAVGCICPSVCPTICFHSNFWTEWPWTMTFCMHTGYQEWKVEVQGMQSVRPSVRAVTDTLSAIVVSAVVTCTAEWLSFDRYFEWTSWFILL